MRRKCEHRTLSERELAEYQALLQQLEARNVKRMEALVALAQRRGTTLRGIMAKTCGAFSLPWVNIPLIRVTVHERPCLRHRFWQPGGVYDRNITSAEALRAVLDYIHANPLRRGLVMVPKDLYQLRLQGHERPYQGGPHIEVPVPHADFDVLNNSIRRWHT